MILRARVGVVLAVVGLLAAACGGGSESTETDAGELLDAGEIELDDDAVPTTTTAAAGTEVAGASESATTTIPVNDEDAEDTFYGAVDEFMACMDTQVGGFAGVPQPQDTADPALYRNSDEYRSALGTCAAQSQIVNSMNAAEDAIADMSGEDVERRNRAFLSFRDCMIGRGWGIPDPAPDENGLLFGTFTDAIGWDPPDGESLDSEDLDDCNLTSLGGDD